VISFVVMILGFSFRMKGRRHVPRRGPVLVIANHQSFFDPIVLSLACSRPLLFLARKSLFQPRWIAWLLRSLGGVPMDQEGVAKEGLKTILRHLQAGEAVVVFPEGTRTADGKLSPLKPGVQLLINRTQAPVPRATTHPPSQVGNRVRAQLARQGCSVCSGCAYLPF
jgi:1-acyl-sn-glycerol-3-phosphate acyltransferase